MRSRTDASRTRTTTTQRVASISLQMLWARLICGSVNKTLLCGHMSWIFDLRRRSFENVNEYHVVRVRTFAFLFLVRYPAFHATM
jgi:hypothetical protein